MVDTSKDEMTGQCAGNRLMGGKHERRRQKKTLNAVNTSTDPLLISDKIERSPIQQTCDHQGDVGISGERHGPGSSTQELWGSFLNLGSEAERPIDVALGPRAVVLNLDLGETRSGHSHGQGSPPVPPRSAHGDRVIQCQIVQENGHNGVRDDSPELPGRLAPCSSGDSTLLGARKTKAKTRQVLGPAGGTRAASITILFCSKDREVPSAVRSYIPYSETSGDAFMAANPDGFELCGQNGQYCSLRLVVRLMMRRPEADMEEKLPPRGLAIEG
ncbi:hypothetical protein DL93DRAFT_2096946 [Clavulina sp. PMI_390]|nr:hypothetical protein DL93DRAFT_2096946 [Clavulina sp. PMI_390]